MRQLRDDTHLRLNGEVRMYRRERSKRWQAAFVVEGQTTIRPAKAPHSTSSATNEKYLYVPAFRSAEKDPLCANFVPKNV